MPVGEHCGVGFRPQDHILFSRLWTVPSGLVPRVSCLTAFSLSIIINFFCTLAEAWFSFILPVPYICAEFFLFVFPLMGKAEWGGNPVCWWLGFYFCFVCCLDEASCTECYWWLGDAGSCIQVILFVWVLTIWYSWWAAVYGVAQSDTTEVT